MFNSHVGCPNWSKIEKKVGSALMTADNTALDSGELTRLSEGRAHHIFSLSQYAGARPSLECTMYFETLWPQEDKMSIKNHH